jgi:hypothetical protein
MPTNQCFLLFIFLTNDDFVLTVLFERELQRSVAKATISGQWLL